MLGQPRDTHDVVAGVEVHVGKSRNVGHERTGAGSDHDLLTADYLAVDLKSAEGRAEV